MAEQPVGKLYVELSLDATKYTKAQKAILAGAEKNSADINRVHKTVGITSDAMYDAMRKNVQNALNAINRSHLSSAEERVRAEKSAAEKIRKINEEQYGKDTLASTYGAIKGHWLAIAGAVATATVAVKAYASQVAGAMSDIDSLKISTIQIASQIATMQGPENVAQNYKAARDYAEDLNRELQIVDAKSFANFEVLQKINQQLVYGGIILDKNNKEQMDAFVTLSNVIAATTVGQNQNMQAMQETRTLLNGEVSARNLVASQIDQLAKKSGLYKDGLKEIVELSKEHGDFLQRIKPLMAGMDAAASDIENTWEAIKSSAQATFREIRRGVFEGFYKEAIDWGGKFVAWIRDNKSEITNFLKDINRALLTGGPSPGAIGGALLAGAASRRQLQSGGYVNEASQGELIAPYAGESGVPVIPPGAPDPEAAEKARKAAEKAAKDAARARDKYLKEQANEAQDFRDLQISLHKEAAKEEEDLLKYNLTQVQEQIRTKIELENQWTDEIQKNTLSQVEYAKWAENQKYQAYKTTYAQDDEMLKLNEDRHKAAMSEIEANANKTFSQEMASAMQGWASQWSGTLNDLLWGAKTTFGDIVESFGKMLTQMYIQKKIMEPLFEFAFGNDKGEGGVNWGSVVSTVGSLFSTAAASQGLAFAGPGIGAYENSIITKPTMFPFAKGIGLMGEGKSPEGVLPLKRMKSGNLGVEADNSNGNGGGVIIHLENPTFQDLETQRRTMEQIANIVANRVAPGAVIRSYKKDEQIRDVIRGRK